MKTKPMSFRQIKNYLENHILETYTFTNREGKVQKGNLTTINRKNKTISLDGWWFDEIEFVKNVRKEDGTKFEVEE